MRVALESAENLAETFKADDVLMIGLYVHVILLFIFFSKPSDSVQHGHGPFFFLILEHFFAQKS